MTKTTIQFLAAVILTTCSIQANAFRLEPMVADFTVDGETSTKTFRIENENKEQIAVKVQAYTRVIDDQGKEKLVETSDFKIYPEQMSLNASDSRAVRVMYVGKKDIDKEQAYRLVASQLPVNFNEDKLKTGIKFLFQFIASVYVTNPKFYPKVEIESVKREKDNLKINIINKGQKHTLLKYVEIEMKDADGKMQKLNGTLIKNWDSENLLSGNRRIFKVKTPLNFDIKANPPKIIVKDEI